MSAALQAAGRAVSSLDGVNLGDLGVNHGAVVSALLLGQLAIAEETARLADEQRTANLIAVVNAHWADGSHIVGTGRLVQAQDQIIERLGLRS